MNHDGRIFVAGHRGLVGSAICRRLDADGYTAVMTAERAPLDLRDQQAVTHFFREHQPEYVFMAAGTVGSMRANMARPAEFIYDNLAMQMNVVHAASQSGVRKLLLLGSSCAYPRDCPQPIKEECLLTGALEPTNEPYAVAKIAAMVMGRAYRSQYGCRIISAMPSTVYGPHDNFNVDSGHVLPAMIRRFHQARLAGERTLTFWGTGAPVRDFLHVDDLADACVFLMAGYDEAGHINIGTGDGITIRDLASLVRDVVHPDASVTFDQTGSDGCPCRVLDVSKIHQLGWRHSIALRHGIAQTYTWFQEGVSHET